MRSLPRGCSFACVIVDRLAEGDEEKFWRVAPLVGPMIVLPSMIFVFFCLRQINDIRREVLRAHQGYCRNPLKSEVSGKHIRLVYLFGYLSLIIFLIVTVGGIEISSTSFAMFFHPLFFVMMCGPPSMIGYFLSCDSPEIRAHWEKQKAPL